MRPPGSAEVLARRRQQALSLLAQGMTLADVAEAVGCAPSSVLRWRDARPRRRQPPGPRAKLRPEQWRVLLRALRKGARAHGYVNELWTSQRIAALIERLFGVHYHPGHLRRLLRQHGWTPQKPERRATERNEREIEAWRSQEWPRLRKRRRGPSRTPGLRR